MAVDVPESLVWKVYPNPGDGKSIHLSFTQNDLGKTAGVRIADVNGKEIFASQPMILDQTVVNLEFRDPVPPGLYILSIAVDQQVSRVKLIVR